MPTYLLLVTTDKTVPATEADRENAPDVQGWVQALDDAGRRVAGDPLMPAAQARTVRVRGGETLVTEGPFAEASEVIVGLDIVHCADVDEAIRVAAGHPMAWSNAIEVREFTSLEG